MLRFHGCVHVGTRTHSGIDPAADTTRRLERSQTSIDRAIRLSGERDEYRSGISLLSAHSFRLRTVYRTAVGMFIAFGTVIGVLHVVSHWLHCWESQRHSTLNYCFIIGPCAPDSEQWKIASKMKQNFLMNSYFVLCVSAIEWCHHLTGQCYFRNRREFCRRKSVI